MRSGDTTIATQQIVQLPTLSMPLRDVPLRVAILRGLLYPTGANGDRHAGRQPSRRGALRDRALALGLLLAVTVGAMSVAAAAPVRRLTEAHATAGFLFNCALFIEWPERSASNGELVIGVVGSQAVSDAMLEIAGRAVNGRTLRVRGLKPTDTLEGVHILFIGDEDARTADAVLRTTRHTSVLTVAAQEGFTARGGTIRLLTQDGKLRFEINMTEVERAGLRVSSKMLGHAKVVR